MAAQVKRRMRAGPPPMNGVGGYSGFGGYTVEMAGRDMGLTTASQKEQL